MYEQQQFQSAYGKPGCPNRCLVYVAVAGMLWLYSTICKRQFLVGNIIVALFSALVPMMTLLDIPPVYRAYGQALLDWGANLDFAVCWILGVAVFAFLTTLSREIIKDAEDFEGDAAYGCRSLPIVLGDACTKWTINGIHVAVVVMLGLAYGFFLRHLACWFSLAYILLLLVIPIALVGRKIHGASTCNAYRLAGNRMKLVMLAGIAYSVILWFVMG